MCLTRALARRVIVGRGGAQILPAATTLRVRVVAPIAERVKVVQQRLGVSVEEAARQVAKIDMERTRFVKDHLTRRTLAATMVC